MKTLKAAEMNYGPDEVEDLRSSIIKLRGEALTQGDFKWAVILSHNIALLAAVKEMLAA
jgi:hypothetical protein